MQEAVNTANENIKNGGGPFGAVIVKDGKIIANTGNSVTNDNDPTAHAEMNAIRKACQVLNTFDLSGCEIYSSCEPCPMCLSGINWAHIDKVYYANTKDDASDIDFDDAFIYDEINKPYLERKIPFIKMDNTEAIKTFQTWTKINKIKY